MIEKSDIFRDFVENALRNNISVSRLALGKHEFPDFNDALIQIECRRKTASKLPSFIAHRDFYFPTLVSAEQSTNELVAEYHASLIKSGKTLLDMTAGLGIDSMTFAGHGLDVTAVEMDSCKADALIHNAGVTGVNLTVINDDSVSLLENTRKRFDWIYVDPARRDENNRRTYAFADCVPNIVECRDLIFNHTDNLLIKASPLLDIDSVTKEVAGVTDIHIVCVKGECKEVLLYCTQEGSLQNIYAVDISDRDKIGIFRVEAEKRYMRSAPEVDDIQQGDYLYEPNAALMKLRCDGLICERFRGMKRVANNTHLFISSELHSDFPGRVMKIVEIPDKKSLKNIKGGYFNVCTRNYPLSSPELAKKLGVKDGGDKFIYGFRGPHSKPLVVIASPGC